jgi:hypothetical protein
LVAPSSARARHIEQALTTARLDVFTAGGHTRALEINIGIYLNGGTTASVLSQAMPDSPVGREFTDSRCRWGVRSQPDSPAGHYTETLSAAFSTAASGSLRSCFGPEQA